jgi:hypothetical protein
MAFIDFPQLTNPFTQIDTYNSQVSGVPVPVVAGYYPNGALNVPGGVYQMPVSVYSKYAGFSSVYSPQTVQNGATHTNTTIDSLTSTSELFVGQTVSGPGVAAGTTVASITSSTAITVSIATTASATVALTFGLGTNVYNGFPPILKYVRYLSTANPALAAGPAVVYYADETGTVVTGVSTEAQGGAAAGAVNLAAGILLPSTATSGITAATLNGNWCWIQVGGLCPGVVLPTAAGLVGSTYTAAAGNFLLVNQAAGTNAYPYFVGTLMSNKASTVLAGDLLINPLLALL